LGGEGVKCNELDLLSLRNRRKPDKTMKVLLDIKDNKATHLLEVLKGLSYVKATQITEEKAVLISEIKEGVENLKLVRKGKLKARPAKELLDEL
jgi:hypothetical protein